MFVLEQSFFRMHVCLFQLWSLYRNSRAPFELTFQSASLIHWSKGKSNHDFSRDKTAFLPTMTIKFNGTFFASYSSATQFNGDTMIFSLLSGLLNPAHAFCGTFVGGAGSDIYNKYSQAAIVRSDNQTTLTIQNDVQGEFSDFAMVIPVPSVLPEDAIHVIDPAVFDSLDSYSQPRLVRYECSDFDYSYNEDFGVAEDAAPGMDTGGTGVSVEAQYIVGEYDIIISECHGVRKPVQLAQRQRLSAARPIHSDA